jgi:hypothetical protein
MDLLTILRESNSSHHSWWELGISNDPRVLKTSRHFLPCLHTLLAPTAFKNYFYYFLLTIINGFVKSDETKNGGNNDNNENQW